MPCVYDAADAEALWVISARAREMKSHAYALRPDDYRILAYRPGSIDFCTSFRYDGADHFTVRSEAPYQAQNAALSVLALKAMRDLYPGRYDDLTADLVREALMETYWPARMEQIRPKVYLDGAHNEDGIARFLEAAGHIAAGQSAVLVFAVVSDKDYGDMIGKIARSGIFSHIIITRISGSRQTDPDALAALFTADGTSGMEVVPDVGDAYRRGRTLQALSGICSFAAVFIRPVKLRRLYMINYEEELKKFKPSLDVDEAEGAIYSRDLTDVIDILKKGDAEGNIRERKGQVKQ